MLETQPENQLDILATISYDERKIRIKTELQRCHIEW